MEDNIEYAYSMMKRRDIHIFLTGNAGTGKSTLVRRFITEHPGECLIMAPTGLAAVNVGGVTVHKFFSFPARPISYNSIKKLSPFDPIDNERINVINKAKYLIIDEISMIRADIMDQIAWFFYKNFNTPFAHLKIIMVGDLDQLPPVVSSEAERSMLLARYKSEFFFDAKVWEQEKFAIVKLTKVWRQTDERFISILNKIKERTITDIELDILNNTCGVYGPLTPENDGVYLCATNKLADMVNSEELNRLNTEAYYLAGEVKGDFNLSKFNIEQYITLKVGCRVMIMRNGTEYSNGSLGTFLGLTPRPENLIIQLDDQRTVYVPKFVFEEISYSYNKDSDSVGASLEGEFIQYPVRVAYAISIHKSQGQTFDKCIIDIRGGAFAHGQVYVALSRCRSLSGIKLISRINKRDLIYSPRVLEFNQSVLVNPIV